ncbi:CehA/McbA family metallohydrolase [Roseiconus lacunae]|uniref:CehA/McbA family metallohydrolase n=1 Tax=Roseiconus lacunae TaxID=2605694 RepID=UPI00190F9683|nr:CehA/McbA family metallohydrolase [Roseiconus lacunae]
MQRQRPSGNTLCQRIAALLLLLVVNPQLSSVAQEIPEPIIGTVDRQPFEAGVKRFVQALEIAGSPLPAADQQTLRQLWQENDQTKVVREIQTVLDRHCLAIVSINPESRVKVAIGPAKPMLDQNGWTNHLVKVVNEAGVTAPLVCTSPQAAPMVRRSSSSPDPELSITPADAQRRWLDIAMYDSQPLHRNLSGLGIEYRIVQLYSRDAGKREATLAMDVGQGTQDLGFRNEISLLFDCRPSVPVNLVIRDHDGTPTTCSLLVKDQRGRIYPNPSRRLAPDFFFHNQVYRASGESLNLAPGTYQITAYRGPEYHTAHASLRVNEGQPARLEFDLQRWIHMARYGWFSGDHHVHAAGCAHYENPSQGVKPEDMLRHLVGEDLNVGCVLSWGPCWYFQKQFFEGDVSSLSKPGYLMRYDVEVSGFPSSHAGHLCLLQLSEDDYPGTDRIDQWPSWTLPVLRWGKEQDGVVGYSHSGWGLALPDYLPGGGRGNLPRQWGGNQGPGRAADRLPDYAMPPFDGIGANEYIVTAAHDVCDFISAVDTPAIWELNIWYHVLNCGFRTRISGETDFPCIYGERVGLGRSYVQVPSINDAAELDYVSWVQGLKAGRSYVGDGMCHLLNFSIGEFPLGGTADEKGRPSEYRVDRSGKQTVRCEVAAMLPAEQDDAGRAIAQRRLDEKPYWHLERAREGRSRKVPVELIAGGQVVGRKMIEADGKPVSLEFELDVQSSTWVAVRVLPSMHSNPIFVTVDDQPIRVSRRSAQWCRDAVDVCWAQKRGNIRPEELDEAKQAYDEAKAIYIKRAEEAIGE